MGMFSAWFKSSNSKRFYNVNLYNVNLHNVNVYNVNLYNVNFYNVNFYNVNLYNVNFVSRQSLVPQLVYVIKLFAHIHRLATEITELQRSINTYNMRYFPQHVLLCTSTVHDQSGDICIQGYLRILWIGNAKSLKKNIHQIYVLCLKLEYFFKSCKT